MTKTTNQPKPKVLTDLEMKRVGGGGEILSPGYVPGDPIPGDIQGAG
jgi:hypothetical protein